MSDNPTVLIVDDMPTILEHAKTLLKNDYKLIPSISGAQALEILKKVKPDAILLDINMPDMDGYEVLGLIRNDPGLKSIPVLLMTVEMTIDMEKKSFEMGANDYIRKPFCYEIITKRIKDQIDLAKYRNCGGVLE